MGFNIQRFSSKNEEEEFRKLVIEISAQRFTHSHQASEYIVRNKLGHKYQHISGILVMKKRGEEWSFDGGFPKPIYARLCKELGLVNNGSQAQPLRFTAYKDLLDK